MEMKTKERAMQIAERLFTNGAGEKAYRLVLMTHDGRDLGGWGVGPAADVIERAIEETATAITDTDPKPAQEDVHARENRLIAERDAAIERTRRESFLRAEMEAKNTELREELAAQLDSAAITDTDPKPAQAEAQILQARIREIEQ
jgi:hypothetical protein